MIRETLVALGGGWTGAAVAYTAADHGGLAALCAGLAVVAWVGWLAAVRVDGLDG